MRGSGPWNPNAIRVSETTTEIPAHNGTYGRADVGEGWW